ncbi:MAG: hypothetical protein IKQ60_08540 [Candidatus Methanomethylophilaceae archaeon]|nr:hypothetical protein [Candidatus Methanomethylophilaceae archaeon]
MQDGCLSLAGALILCRRPDRFLEGTYVKIGLFDSGSTLLEEDVVKAPLVLQPQISVRRLFKKYVESRIVYGNLFLDAVYDYPVKAVQEAVTNACVHKDLFSGCPVEIRVYPDRMTITNDGSLPDGWTVADLLCEHRSKPRNTRIADAFHDSGLMGCWGKGIELMTSECAAAGIPSPDFYTDGRSFTVTFRLFDDAPEPFVEEQVEVPSSLESRIVDLVAEGSLRTGTEFSEALGINRRQFTRVMSKLMSEGVVAREGNRRKGRWVLATKQEGDERSGKRMPCRIRPQEERRRVRKRQKLQIPDRAPRRRAGGHGAGPDGRAEEAEGERQGAARRQGVPLRQRHRLRQGAGVLPGPGRGREHQRSVHLHPGQRVGNSR